MAPAANKKATATTKKAAAKQQKRATVATKKPAAANKKATAATKKPAAANKQATAATKRPAAANKKATAATKRPAAANKKATAATKKPAAANNKATAATKKPAAANNKAGPKERRTTPKQEAARTTAATAKRTTTTSGTQTRAARTIAAAVLRELEAALGRTEPALQVQGLADVLATLGARARPTAAALLAKTRRGSELAHAYLTALGDSDAAIDAANQLVRHCATMERGRKALRGAFAAVWRNATDAEAIDEACKNFARGVLDDIDVLDAAVDAAAKLGDTAGAASLAARLERAHRLAPLVAALAGPPSQRARAKRELAELAEPDRWHVHARVLDNPRAFDQDVAVAAVRALADDPSVGDLALSPAIVEMRHHGTERLAIDWQLRVAAGDAALITRLLGLFEWTALWATAKDQLEPYLDALYPAGARPEVFASVEHALAGTSMVVRQAVLDRWLADAHRTRAFDDAQVDKLVRMAVTIAEAGDDTDDRRAASRALSRTAHPGACHAVFDAVRNASTTKSPELRRHLYAALERIDHAEVLAFLVERLFVEHEDYAALVAALATKIDATTHVRVLGTLVERADDDAAIHAATLYADTLLHAVHEPRLVIDLARVVIGWRPGTNDDARRLRYIFERATLAALDHERPDDARTFATRARELPDAPYSDHVVKALDQRTPAAFTDPAAQQRLAALEG